MIVCNSLCILIIRTLVVVLVRECVICIVRDVFTETMCYGYLRESQFRPVFSRKELHHGSMSLWFSWPYATPDHAWSTKLSFSWDLRSRIHVFLSDELPPYHAKHPCVWENSRPTNLAEMTLGGPPCSFGPTRWYLPRADSGVLAPMSLANSITILSMVSCGHSGILGPCMRIPFLLPFISRPSTLASRSWINWSRFLLFDFMSFKFSFEIRVNLVT